MPAETIVLIVEDDSSFRRSLAATLKAADYKPIEADTLAAAARAIAHYRPALILLDLGLPDGDGVDFVAKLRQSALTPVVVITARDAEAMKVAALDAGADDYVTKPFGVDELLARMRAALRHAVQAKGAEPVVRTGALEINLATRIVRLAGAEIDLTPKEYEILALLAAQVGKVARHRDVLKTVWGSEGADMQYLRVYVRQIRAKIEADPSAPRYLISEAGVGYRLAQLG
ncbi:MAG: response regulator [Hyphomonadaceae bacterium]|nr:response regulator [Hyphomonadaceae bacterium]